MLLQKKSFVTYSKMEPIQVGKMIALLCVDNW